MIRFYCPNGHKLEMEECHRGRKATCSTCGAKFIVPGVSNRPTLMGSIIACFLLALFIISVGTFFWGMANLLMMK